MKVLIICPSKLTATGNVCTVRRIQKHLLSDGIDCITKDAGTIRSESPLCARRQLFELVCQENVTGILFLHAYKSAKILICSCTGNEKCSIESSTCSVPYGIVFGGTDLYLDAVDPDKCLCIQKVLNEANFAVAFTDALKQKALQIVPKLEVLVQPQAIELPELACSLRDTDDNFVENCNAPRFSCACVFLMVTGIRPVKDPLYILNPWIELCETYKDLNMKLLILGPVLDEEYAKIFFHSVKSLEEKYLSKNVAMSYRQNFEGLNGIFRWLRTGAIFPILYAPPLSYMELEKLMSSSQIFASINSSLSEGMSSAVLESMAHRIPVVARNNDGNAAVITDNETGLLFQSRDDFARQIERLISEAGLRGSLVSNAIDRIMKLHSIADEKEFYYNLCRKYFFNQASRSTDT